MENMYKQTGFEKRYRKEQKMNLAIINHDNDQRKFLFQVPDHVYLKKRRPRDLQDEARRARRYLRV